MNTLEYIRSVMALLSDINEILKQNSLEPISLSDITVTQKTVSDIVKPDERLSSSIINHVWPSIESATVYHYTSKSAAESILNSGTFRLYCILKRFKEDEISAFCKIHSLDGYLEKDDLGNEKYKTMIMPNTFYSSFTDSSITADQEEYFWRTFASVDGVRIKIQIQASNPNFRKMQCADETGQPIKILSDLTNLIKTKYDRDFILKGMSRLCAFYLSKDYDIENEFRILHRYWEGLGPKPKNDGTYDYIEIPLGSMSEIGYQLEITEVQSNETLSIPDKYSVMPRNA